MSEQKNKRVLRSQSWFGGDDKDSFIHRSWMKNQGFPSDAFDGRPVIGICNTWSELTPCNGHFRDLAEMVKRGVLEAGGFPVEFPVMSLGETQLRPTAVRPPEQCLRIQRAGAQHTDQLPVRQEMGGRPA